MDSILNLDRMRQSVHLREEQLKSRPKNLNKSFQQANGTADSGPGIFMRKTLSVPNISQLHVPSSGTNSTASKLALLNGNIPKSSTGPSGSAVNESIGTSLSRRSKPIRSESLANLSGFISGGHHSSVTDAENNTPQSRPNSLNIGKSLTPTYLCL